MADDSGGSDKISVKKIKRAIQETSGSSSSAKSVNSSASGASSSSQSDVNFTLNDTQKTIDEYVQLSISSATAKVEQLFNEKVVFLEQAERKIRNMLADSTKLMSSIRDGLEASKQLTESSIKTQAELQDEVRAIKGNAISALSIFVSFFAFITVAINVFSKAESVVSASVLVLIFWCLLIGFNLLISIQFKVFSGDKTAIIALLFVIFVSVSSVFAMFYFSPELQGVKYVFKFSV